MLNVKLLPKQWEVFHPDQDVHYDIKLYQGGVGSGKTFLGSLTGLSVLSKNHGATWLVGADTYARLKITTCETYEELLDSAKVKHKHNKSDHIIKISGWDDARIIFKGVDDPQALRSVNGIGGHLEEASLISEASYLEFLGRLRQAGNEQAIRCLLTTNPQTVKGWLHDHFVVNAGVHTETIRGNEIRVSRRRVIARTLDNPHVSDAFIASLKTSYDEKLWDIMVEGKDGDYTAGLVSYSFSDLNIQDTPYKRDLTLHITCDFNVNPMSWALAHRYNGEYHFFDEVVKENTNIEACVDRFVERYPNHEQWIEINGDASGNARNVQNKEVGGTSYTQMVNRLKQHGYTKVRVNVRDANPAEHDRAAAWNAMVCNADGVRRVYIDPKCKWLIWNCQNLKYDEKGRIWEPTVNDIRQDDKLKYTKHVWDAASYLVEKYDPIILRRTEKRPGLIVPKALSKF
jgi:PBSX family phage terminase large subunit